MRSATSTAGFAAWMRRPTCLLSLATSGQPAMPSKAISRFVSRTLSGRVYTFRTQSHMRIHLYVVVVVLLLGLFINLGQREMLVLLFTVSLVIIAEMFNSAIEATVDLIQPNYHPLAKFAKDISAGAVLITTIIALVVGGLLILGESRWEQIKISMTSESLGVGIVPRILVGCFLL